MHEKLCVATSGVIKLFSLNLTPLHESWAVHAIDMFVFGAKNTFAMLRQALPVYIYICVCAFLLQQLRFFFVVFFNTKHSHKIFVALFWFYF